MDNSLTEPDVTKLSPGAIREIRQLFAEQAGFPTICQKFGVSRERVLELCTFGRRADSRRHSQAQSN